MMAWLLGPDTQGHLMAGVRAAPSCARARGIFPSPPWCHLIHTLRDQLCSPQTCRSAACCTSTLPPGKALGQMHQMPLGKACWLQFQGPFWEPGGASWTPKHPGVLILPRFGFLQPCLVGKEDLGCSGVWFGLGWVYFPDLCGVPSPWHSSDLFYIFWVQLGWDVSAGLPVPPAALPQSVPLRLLLREVTAKDLPVS